MVHTVLEGVGGEGGGGGSRELCVHLCLSSLKTDPERTVPVPLCAQVTEQAMVLVPLCAHITEQAMVPVPLCAHAIREGRAAMGK